MRFTPIIKPVGGRCNLSCTYCYFKQKTEGKTHTSLMTKDITRSVIDAFCENQKVVEFIWHGGEPFLAGLDFYKYVLEYEYEWIKKGQRIYNSIQTNGTLLDKKWLQFLAQNQDNFGISISLDGPADLHDPLRFYPNKNGSHKEIIRAIHYLEKEGVTPHVICCVSSLNCDSPERVFTFLVERGIKNIKFLQVQGRDSNGKLLPSSVSPRKYADFLITILKKWIELDDPEIEIREIRSIISTMLGGETGECIFAGECYKYLTIYQDGSIYGCDSLPKIESLRLGHINNGIKGMEQSPPFIRFRNRLDKIKKRCIACEWHRICKGGCLEDWWPNIFSNNTRNLFCGELKRIFSTTKKILNDYGLIKG